MSSGPSSLLYSNSKQLNISSVNELRRTMVGDTEKLKVWQNYLSLYVYFNSWCIPSLFAINVLCRLLLNIIPHCTISLSVYMSVFFQILLKHLTKECFGEVQHLEGCSQGWDLVNRFVFKFLALCTIIEYIFVLLCLLIFLSYNEHVSKTIWHCENHKDFCQSN